jgi:DNA-binding transcriptional ArsR family regulator
MSSEQEPPAGQEPESLSDPKAMRALAHPVRMALLELLGVAGTVTATQASEVLGESPANCAFHLRTLAKYGFVKEAGGGRGRERPWTRAQRTIRISATDQTDPQAALAADALGRLWLERWMDRARQVFGSSARVPGWEHATQSSRSGVFLTPEETVRVAQDMQAIIDRYRDREHDPSLRPAGALPVECTFFTYPITDYARLIPPAPAPGPPAAAPENPAAAPGPPAGTPAAAPGPPAAAPGTSVTDQSQDIS